MDAKLFERLVVAGLGGLILIALAALLYFARPLLLPIFVGVFLALVLQPIVRRLGVRRPLGAIVLMLAVGVLVAVALWKLTEPAIAWMDRIPTIATKLEIEFWELRRSIEAAEEASKQLKEIAEGEQGEIAERVVLAEQSFAQQVFGSLWSFMGQAGITVGLLFFLLAFGDETAQRVTRAFEMRGTRRRLREVTRDIERRTATFLRTITLINIGVGILTTAALWALGVPNAALWGVMAGCLNYMPYLGPAVMLVVLGAISVVTFEDPISMVAPLAAYGLITGIEGQFVTPAILGRQMTLNPIAVFLAIVVWFWIWGVAGAIIAVPLLASMKIVAEQVPGLQPLSSFLGRPEPSSGNNSGTEVEVEITQSTQW